jgi:hypothetical protein
MWVGLMMAKNSPSVTCVSIIICDDIFEDKGTNKKALWGTFNYVSSMEVPVTHPRMCLFVTITNGRGVRNIGVSIEKASSSEPIIEINGPMQFSSPLDIVDLSLSLHNLVFPEFGKYWVTVKDEGRILSQRSFTVKKLKKMKKRGGRDEQPNV